MRELGNERICPDYHNARNGFQLEELNRVRALGKIRDELGEEGIEIKDIKDKTIWNYK